MRATSARSSTRPVADRARSSAQRSPAIRADSGPLSNCTVEASGRAQATRTVSAAANIPKRSPNTLAAREGNWLPSLLLPPHLWKAR